ncbi:MAG: serine/threonine protein kinase [Planctomycetes bacterium]|nr:serine/threonine protein kinase [Planctomycetota bacterium]
METARTCARCGALLAADQAADQPCPRCLLRIGVQSSAGAPTGARAPAPSLAELQPYFARLELLALVGEGGMGAVYKARDKELERVVALKILTVQEGERAQFDERFAREARALARLAHPNIAGVHDHGRAGPWSYLVLEYVDGENLRRVMRSRGVKPAEALRWVGEICSALQYAHDNGVVHRDIKPENVLVDAAGRIKVVDFGLAKLSDRRPGEATLTGTQQSLGTWHYMAPEQYERPQTVDHRADIYSLGVVLYELLTGEVPVGRFELPSQKIQVDVRVDDVVLKSLAREPEKRYQAIGEVKRQVDDIERGAPPVASAPPSGVARRAALWPWLLAAAGIVAVGGALALLFIGARTAPIAASSAPSVAPTGVSGIGAASWAALAALPILLSMVLAGVAVVLALRSSASKRGQREPALGAAHSGVAASRALGRSSPWMVLALVLGGLALLAGLAVLAWIVAVPSGPPPVDLGASPAPQPPATAFPAVRTLLAAVVPVVVLGGALLVLAVVYVRRSRAGAASAAVARGGTWLAGLVAVVVMVAALFGCLGYWYLSDAEFARNDVPRAAESSSPPTPDVR